MIHLRTVLVATDFSTPAETAVKYGQELARRFGASLQLIHVTDNAYASPSSPDGVLPVSSSFSATWSTTTGKRIDEQSARDHANELQARGVVRDSGNVAGEIIAYAKECEADLLVIGTHGRRGAARLLLGSVADKVLQAAPCPVLVVRQPEHEFIAPDALAG